MTSEVGDEGVGQGEYVGNGNAEDGDTGDKDSARRIEKDKGNRRGLKRRQKTRENDGAEGNAEEGET